MKFTVHTCHYFIVECALVGPIYKVPIQSSVSHVMHRIWSVSTQQQHRHVANYC